VLGWKLCEFIFLRIVFIGNTLWNISLCTLNHTWIWSMRRYEGRLKSSWTHLITPSRNFVKVRWRSLFRSTSLGKWYTSYNAPPTSRKRAVERWSLRSFLPRSSLFMVEKDQKSHGARSGLYGGCSNGVPPIYVFQPKHRIQFKSQFMPISEQSNCKIPVIIFRC
jgi:hypothetical protein